MESQITKFPKIKIEKGVFNKLPQTPGVYVFWKKNNIIYVGKSINLKSRLTSYLNINLGTKTKNMVEEADCVSTVKVFSELESLLLEAKLINKLKPKYNIIAKDDKHPLYVVITNDEFPKLVSSRKPITDNCIAIFGPFPSSKNVKTILKLIRRVLPYSNHVAVTGKLGKRPCMHSQIGLCNPCPNVIYKIKNPESKKKLIKTYKQNIKNINRLLEGKFTQVQKNLYKKMNKLSKEKKYEEAIKLRDQLKVLEYITQPKIPSNQFLKNPNLEEDIRKQEIEKLRTILAVNYHLPVTLHRIECFDVAHLSGVNATASMVVAINGQMENSLYKHFKIKQVKTQSDFDSMKEVAKRRLKNIKLWGTPDLIIVDGGLSQVKAFSKIFKNITVVGIAKNPDRLVFPNGKKAKLKGQTLQLVSRLRDEAHRFARRYHHLLMKKSLLS